MRCVDHLTVAERSHLMSRIRSRGTKPELAVHALLRAVCRGSGLRIRTHARGLPGSPDFVIVAERVAVFVHGCFWHRHEGCRLCTVPQTRRAYWRDKFDANVRRDRRAARALRARGWRVITIWECRLRHPAQVSRRLARAVRVP